MEKYIPDFINLNIPFFILLIIGFAAVLLTYWYYKNPNPSIKKTGKYVLASLRISVLFLIILLFFSPRLDLTFHEKYKDKIAVFVDNSASVSYNPQEKDRWDKTKRLVISLRELLPKEAQVEWYQFNNILNKTDEDTLIRTRLGTNFGPVLKKIKTGSFDKSIIITDGINTEGSAHTELTGITAGEIYTIGLGPNYVEKDISVSNAIYKPFVYQGEKQDIEIQLDMTGKINEEALTLKLYSRERLISSAVVTLGGIGERRTIKLSYTPRSSGLSRLKVVLDTFAGELNRENNTYIFVQQVLQNKVRIGLFSGYAGYEYKFLRLLMKRNKDFEVFSFVEKNNGQFYGKPGLQIPDSLDIVVLIDYPGPFTQSAVFSELKSFIKKNHPGIIAFCGEKINQVLFLQRPFLPVKKLPLKTGTRLVNVKPGKMESVAALLSIFPEKYLNYQFWKNVPPVSINRKWENLKDDAVILLTASSLKEQVTIGAVITNAGHKSVLLNGSDFWKWHFVLQDEPEIKTGYTRFINHLIRWVMNRRDIKPVSISVDRKISYNGQPVTINGHLYDGNLQQIKNGDLILQAEWGGQKFNIETAVDSFGNHTASFIPPGEGKFLLSAEGFLDGTLLGKNQLEVEVIPFAKEYVRLEQNSEFLKSLASGNNGFYVSESAVDSLRPAFLGDGKNLQIEKRLELWYAPFLLFLIILLITFEWIIRKRLGLV